jgi:hypothetical protein
MKTTNLLTVLLITFFTISLFSLAGCSSTGMERSNEATTTMQTMDSDIKLVIVQLDATGASLDELTNPIQTDVKKAFNLYSDNVEKIANMEKDFAKHSNEMKARGKDYFEEWQQEDDKYKNTKIQDLSEQRRLELDETYSMIAQNSLGVEEAFKEYVSDVKEIQIYLSNDLTSQGIESISPISKKVVNDGDNLKNAIKNVQMAIEKARTAMALK